MKIRVTLLDSKYPLYRDCNTIVEAYECLKYIIETLIPDKSKSEFAKMDAMINLVKIVNGNLLKSENARYSVQKVDDDE